MTSNIKNEKNEKSDDAVVEKIFDELIQSRIISEEVHPSETVNRVYKNFLPQGLPYDLINEYHAYCKYCDKHFYTCSKLNDINSFFQKHVNSSYHIMCKIAYNFPSTTPIFEWEKCMFRARCNICNISGLQAFIVDLIFDAKKVIDIHISKDHKNYKEIPKHSFALKKYFCLSFFLDVFFKEEKDSVVCLLCYTKFFGTKKDNICHFGSELHFQNCLNFIWLNLRLSAKDLINGYHLENVTRWFLKLNLRAVFSAKVLCLKRDCLLESNTHDAYNDIHSHFGFCLQKIEEMLKFSQKDLMYRDFYCLLCDQQATNNHNMSMTHKQNLKNWKLFKSKPNYPLFLKNIENRIMPHYYEIKMYKEMETFMNEFAELANDKNAIEQYILNNETRAKSNKWYFPNRIDQRKTKGGLGRNAYSNILIRNKIRVIQKFKKHFPTHNFYCQVCDTFVATGSMHWGTKDHINAEKIWQKVEKDSSDPKYTEPFFLIKPKKFICLLCGLTFRPGKLIYHAVTNEHMDLYQAYAESQKITQFESNGSCYCTVCNARIVKGELTWTQHFEQIKRHWSCSINGPEITEELKNIFEGNKEIVLKNQNVIQNIPVQCSICYEVITPNELESHTLLCSKINSKPLENQLNRDEIIQKIADNEVSLISDSEACEKFLDYFESQNEDVSSEEEEETDDISLFSSNDETEETRSKGSNSGEKNDNGILLKRKKKKKSRKKKDVEDFDQEQEILIVTGISKKDRKEGQRNFSFVLKRYAEIQNMLFEGDASFITFKEPGIAKKVVEDPPILFKNRQYEVSYLITSFTNACELFLNMSKKLIVLLENPKQLINWAFELLTDANISNLSIDKEKSICETIIQSVKAYYPFCRCYPFGSRVSGLILKSSDVDVFLDLGGMYEGYNPKYGSQQKTIAKVSSALKKKPAIIEDIVVIKNARVPIISFLHKPTSLRCDISFKNGLSVQNTLLIKFLVSYDWRVKFLILSLKVWADWNEMHGFPYFSSYAICMLVIFCLQQPPNPVLPPLEVLMKNYNGPRLTIDGWDCNFAADTRLFPKKRNSDDFPQMLLQFFEFYAGFEYSKYVISPLTGTALPRAAFTDAGVTKLPMAVKKQALCLPFPLASWVSDSLPFCLMDPFDLSHILTKCFSKRSLERFVRFCELSKSLLKKGLTTS